MQSTPRRVAALAAVLGLPLSVLAVSPASAGPLSGQAGTASSAVLVSQLNGTASTAPDRSNSTVRLEALGGPSVTKVRFEYTTDPEGHPRPTYTPIETVSRNDDGAFAAEWNAGSFPLGIRVRPVAITSSGGETPGADESFTVSSGVRSVNVANGSSKGYFVQPYAGKQTLITVSGALSDVDTAARGTVGWLRKDTDGYSLANGQPTELSKGGSFTVILPIADGPAVGSLADYDLTDGDPDQIAVVATAGPGGAGTDDVEAFTLYEQKITTVTAVADRTTVSPGESATVTVTVVDDKGAPIPGAEVVDANSTRSTDQAAWDIRYTDALGQATFQLAPGSNKYYANISSHVPYEFTDKLSNEVTVSTSSPQGQPGLVGSSADGQAFDLDEVDNTQSQSTGNPPLPGSTPGDGDPTDVTVQIVDANGVNRGPSSGQELSYFWTVTPFVGGTAARHPATGTSSGTHEGGGKYDVVVPAAGNGIYELFAQLSNDSVTGIGVPLTKVLTVRAGQAAVVWDRTSPESAAAGDTYTATGRLALPDGTGLPGRALALTFQRDTTTTDEDPSPDAGFDAGTASPTTSLATTTNAAGAFAATLRDPLESPQRSELGDNIDVTSAANAIGNAGASAVDQVVNFVHDTVPAALRITESREGARTRPGEYTVYTAKVVNRLGGGVADQTVTLVTDGGYFSRPDGSAASPTPVSSTSGTDVGAYRNDGRSVSLATGPDGTARVFLAMGRDTRFDDDGALTTTVSGMSGLLSGSDSHAWTTDDPLNGGTVSVTPSTGAQDSGILPEAQTVDSVVLDVALTDGFGNPVAGEPVSLTDDSDGTISEGSGTANDGLIVSDLDSTGDLVLTSPEAEPQQVTASWTTETLRYGVAGAPPTAGSETLTDDYTVEWYEIDRAASTYSLTPDDSSRAPVGSTMSLTYRALDQKGQPVPDLAVLFKRTGPDGTFSTEGGTTGQDGAVGYSFVGRERGRWTVTATPRSTDSSGVVDEGIASSAVSFGPPLRIVASLTGSDNGRAADRLALSTSDVAAGARVRLFEVATNGRRTLVGTGVVGADGTEVIVVTDGDRSRTTYVARVVGNDAVRRTTSNEVSVR